MASQVFTCHGYLQLLWWFDLSSCWHVLLLGWCHLHQIQNHQDWTPWYLSICWYSMWNLFLRLYLQIPWILWNLCQCPRHSDSLHNLHRCQDQGHSRSFVRLLLSWLRNEQHPNQHSQVTWFGVHFWFDLIKFLSGDICLLWIFIYCSMCSESLSKEENTTLEEWSLCLYFWCS